MKNKSSGSRISPPVREPGSSRMEDVRNGNRRWVKHLSHTWDMSLDEALRERSPSGPEPTDEERYHDANPAWWDPDLPWLDSSDDREAEIYPPD